MGKSNIFEHNPFHLNREQTILNALQKIRLLLTLNQSDVKRNALNKKAVPILKDPIFWLQKEGEENRLQKGTFQTSLYRKWQDTIRVTKLKLIHISPFQKIGISLLQSSHDKIFIYKERAAIHAKDRVAVSFLIILTDNPMLSVRLGKEKNDADNQE